MAAALLLRGNNPIKVTWKIICAPEGFINSVKLIQAGMICFNTASLRKRNSQHLNNITRSLAPPNCHLDPAPLTHPSDHHMQWHKTNPHWPVRPVKAPQCREKCPGRPFTAALTCTILNRPSRRVIKGLIKQLPGACGCKIKESQDSHRCSDLTQRLMEKRLGLLLRGQVIFFLIFNTPKTKQMTKSAAVWCGKPHNRRDTQLPNYDSLFSNIDNVLFLSFIKITQRCQ